MIEATTTVPTTIISGDSYSVVYAASDAINDGWTAILHLTGISSIVIPGTTDNGSYAFAITSNKSSLLSAGSYSWAITITKDSERLTLETGTLTVLGNSTTADSKLLQTERILAAINSAIEGRFTDDVVSISIAGRSISMIPMSELMEYRAVYTRELSTLKGIASGRRTIPVSFGRI